MAARWVCVSPEVNAGQLMLGDQGASIAAAAVAYEALAAALMAEAAKMAATTGCHAQRTVGTASGGAAMTATAIPYIAALELLAVWVQQSAASAAAILQAYSPPKRQWSRFRSARPTASPRPASSRRTSSASTPRSIIGLDMEYYDMFWPQQRRR